MRFRSPRRRYLDPVPLEEIGAIQGHRIQALPQRTTFLVDGRLAVLCSPLEYRLALRLLRAARGHPLQEQPLWATLSVDRRSLWKLVTALRRKLFGPLGLEVLTIPRYGYLLEDAEPHRDHRRTRTATPSLESVSPRFEWVVWLSSIGKRRTPHGIHPDYWRVASDGAQEITLPQASLFPGDELTGQSNKRMISPTGILPASAPQPA